MNDCTVDTLLTSVETVIGQREILAKKLVATARDAFVEYHEILASLMAGEKRDSGDDESIRSQCLSESLGFG